MRTGQVQQNCCRMKLNGLLFMPHLLLILKSQMKTSAGATDNFVNLSYITPLSYRLLDYICNKDGPPSLMCNFNVMQNRTNPRARTTAHTDKLLSPFPLTLGHLRVCRSADFRKAHRSVDPSFLKCHQQDLKKFVVPSVEDADEFVLEVDTYYMTRKNYEDMKLGKTPQVYIPYELPESDSSTYSVPVTAVLLHYAPVLGCIIKTPFEKRAVVPEQPITTYASTMIYWVGGDLLNKSGVYTYVCSGMKPNAFTGETVRETLSASLSLNFVREASMSIEGHDDFLVTYPANTDSANFIVNIYTTSKVVNFEVVDADEFASDHIYTVFHSYHPHEIVARYEVGISPLMFLKRNYTLHATNLDGRFATQKIQVLKADRLDVSINPETSQAIEGFLAIFDCVAKGSLVRSVQWSRDYEPLDPMKYGYRVETVSAHHRTTLRLVLVDLKLNHSGIYICTVSNEFETLQESATLVVWPNDNVYVLQVFSGDKPVHMLASAEVQPLVEYIPPNLGSVLLLLGMASATLCCVLVAGTSTSLVCCACKRARVKARGKKKRTRKH